MQRDRQDIAGGLVLGALGAAVAIYAALHYDIGTLRRMGPGFFPVALGMLLALLGLAVARPPLGRVRPSVRVAWPELAAVLAAILIFALGLERLGLVAATFAAALTASVAAPRAGVLWRLALALAITGIAVLIFHAGLAMSLPLWPRVS